MRYLYLIKPEWYKEKPKTDTAKAIEAYKIIHERLET